MEGVIRASCEGWGMHYTWALTLPLCAHTQIQIGVPQSAWSHQFLNCIVAGIILSYSCFDMLISGGNIRLKDSTE